MKPRLVAALSFLAIGFVATDSVATTLESSAFVTAGGAAASASRWSVASVGQSIAGRTTASGYRLDLGFVADAVLNSVDVPTDPTPGVTRFRWASPNPSNSAVRVEFDIAQATPVTLKLFDVRGRLVRVLVNKPYAPGSFSVVWDGATREGGRAAPGVYFCAFQGGSTRSVQRIVLIR